MIQTLTEQGWLVCPLALGDGFPWPTAATCDQALDSLKHVPSEHLLVIDGLALGALPQAAQYLHQLGRPFTALVHHPLAREAGITVESAQQLHQSEYKALQCASGVIVTSAETARTVSNDFDLLLENTVVAHPGTDRPSQVSLMVSAPTKRPKRLLSVGSLVPRKGFDVLIQALAPLTELDWHLKIVGDDTRDLATTVYIKKLIHLHQLQDRIDCTGAVDQETLLDHFATADIFVLASHYEGYGMAFAEALAAGLPIIGTTGGAIPDTVPTTAGILVEPGNITAFSEALKHLLTQHALYEQLKLGARVCASHLPTWEQSAIIFSDALVVNHNQTVSLVPAHKPQH
jgi:glycosyltransferase involved in cell wall biosynthesis